jgi:hypothetical protein
MNGLRGWMAAAAGLAVVMLYAWFLRRATRQAKPAPKPPVVDCPDCKGKVSTQLKACPHCGRPLG